MADRLFNRGRYADAEAEYRTLSGVKGVVVPFKGWGEFASNYIFPIVLTQGNAACRDAVREKLHAAGVQTSVHYPAVHRFSIYRDFPADLPQTEFVTDHEITLPMYAALTEEQLVFIVETLTEALHG